MTLGKINLAVFAAIRCHQDHCAEISERLKINAQLH